jgi:hypothetical protein
VQKFIRKKALEFLFFAEEEDHTVESSHEQDAPSLPTLQVSASLRRNMCSSPYLQAGVEDNVPRPLNSSLICKSIVVSK